MKKNNEKLLEKLRKRYRLAIFNESTYEEIFGMHLSRLNVYLIIGVSLSVYTTMIIVLIAFTPLRNYLPDAQSKEMDSGMMIIFYGVLLTMAIALIFVASSNNYTSVLKKKKKSNKIRHLFKLQDRFQELIKKRKRAANAYLVIGILISIGALSVLGFTLFFQELNDKELSNYYIPRISFAFFVQTISFFFLRLYLNLLKEAKFFEDELTSLQYKIAAYKLSTNNQDVIPDLIKSYTNVERNNSSLVIKDEVNGIDINTLLAELLKNKS
ncbi:hypothetical protein KDU71_07510 [Carboxylicivirga sediminis]|uniref:Uncharacterized protein n=1 Tax=Carboxylicivirga sediminis TaxID=2006564 RepID=A0A941F3R0_9BACT|nr:hypothetical protein [Carboxylicivirga sediminis]MBR8535403.1 hypothetical protein [Carboxylicivirga sediminis]